MKYFANGEKATKALSRPEYETVQKVTASDHVRHVRQQAKRQATRNAPSRPAQAAQYDHTRKTVSDTLGHDTVRSAPLTRKEAHQLARESRKGNAPLSRARQQQAIIQITAVVSGAQNLHAYAKGDIDGVTAVTKTAKSTVCAAADGAVRAATGTMVQVGAIALAETTKQEGKSFAGKVARGNVAMAIGTATAIFPSVGTSLKVSLAASPEPWAAVDCSPSSSGETLPEGLHENNLSPWKVHSSMSSSASRGRFSNGRGRGARAHPP